MPDDLVPVVREALQHATPGPWTALPIGDQRGDGEAQYGWDISVARPPEESSQEMNDLITCGEDGGGAIWSKRDAHLIAHAPEWLARLCQEVEALRAEREHDRAVIAAYTEAVVSLRDDLRLIADYNVSVEHGEFSERTEAAAFHDCRKVARMALKDEYGGRGEKEGSGGVTVATPANRPQHPATIASLEAEVSALRAQRDALREGLQKVIAHTGYLPSAPYELLEGLLQSCARVSRAALASAPPEGNPPASNFLAFRSPGARRPSE